MKLAVIGGRLQGVEIAYLAQKAGWEVFLVDRDKEAPARKLCNHFHPLEITAEKDLDRVIGGVDLVIPAVENERILTILYRWAQGNGIPIAFDPASYSVSSSKVRSNELFEQNGIPYPRPWPECSFPLIAKASSGSGSENVHLITSNSDLQNLDACPGGQWVIQEWEEGPSYSLEVIGTGKDSRVFQVTELEMDAGYDCKRVIAPALLDEDCRGEFSEIALRISRALNLFGIMDVEIIISDRGIKVLEIDARFPSQTPTAVYHSSGVNLVEFLGKLTLDPMSNLNSFPLVRPIGVIYEHIKITPGILEVAGEHIMTGYGPLLHLPDFCGADEVLTSYAPGISEWAATLIVTGASREEAWLRRNEVIKDMMKQFKLSEYRDPYPQGSPPDYTISRGE